MANNFPTIPFNDLGRMDLDTLNAVEKISAVVKSGWWLNGKQNQEFSSELARYLDVAHCINVANGTDALEIAMRALLQFKSLKGGEVITVANAGGYASIAARLVGLTPVYVDVDQHSHLIDNESVTSVLSEQTALVVATHLYGGVVDIEGLRAAIDAAGYRHVPILEDCAQAHGAALNRQKVGGLAEVATFSFYPTKNLGALGDAGAIVTNGDELARICRSLSQYGWDQKYDVANYGGRNSRMDEIQASLLRTLLPKLDEFNARRLAVLDRYQESCSSKVRLVRSRFGTVAHLAVVMVDDRESFRTHLRNQGISSDIHYPILDIDQTGWRNSPMRIAPDNLQNSRDVVEKIVSIPCYPTLSDEEVERICYGLQSW